jgi:hypothetical protein
MNSTIAAAIIDNITWLPLLLYCSCYIVIYWCCYCTVHVILSFIDAAIVLFMLCCQLLMLLLYCSCYVVNYCRCYCTVHVMLSIIAAANVLFMLCCHLMTLLLYCSCYVVIYWCCYCTVHVMLSEQYNSSVNKWQHNMNSTIAASINDNITWTVQ